MKNLSLIALLCLALAGGVEAVRTDRASTATRTTTTDRTSTVNPGAVQALTLTRSPVGTLSHADAASLRQGSAFTVQCWVNPATAATTQDIVSKYDAGSNCEYRIVQLSTGVFRFRVSSDGGNVNGASHNHPTAVATGTWYHVVGRMSGTTNDIWVNGVLDSATAPAAWTGGGTATFRVGALSDGVTNPYGGTVEKVAFWQRALSDAEVTALYNNGVPPAYDQLPASMLTSLSLWALDPQMGNTAISNFATDRTGANTLTASGSGISVVTGLGEFWRLPS